MKLYFRREAALNAFPQLFENEVEAVAWHRPGATSEKPAPKLNLRRLWAAQLTLLPEAG